MKTCSSCQNEVAGPALKCQHCGVNLGAICEHCGAAKVKHTEKVPNLTARFLGLLGIFVAVLVFLFVAPAGLGIVGGLLIGGISIFLCSLTTDSEHEKCADCDAQKAVPKRQPESTGPDAEMRKRDLELAKQTEEYNRKVRQSGE